MSIDEKIEKKVNQLLDVKIKELRLELQKDDNGSLKLPCTKEAFKRHMSKNGRPMPHTTFSKWRQKGWVTCNGKMVVSINKYQSK